MVRAVLGGHVRLRAGEERAVGDQRHFKAVRRESEAVAEVGVSF